MYNFRAEQELGIKIAVRRIAWACDACIAQLMKPWKPGVKAEDEENAKQAHPVSTMSCSSYQERIRKL